MAANSSFEHRRVLGLIGAVAWIRRQELLLRLYRLLPIRLRTWVAQRLGRSLQRNLRFPRTAKWGGRVDGPKGGAKVNRPPSTASDAVGVNVFGYLSGEFGLAESARLYSRALMDAGAKVALFDTPFDPLSTGDDSFSQLVSNVTPHDINLIFVNPDYLDEAMAEIGPKRLRGKLYIACWYWELPTIPAHWGPAIEAVDAILVASKFVADAFRKATHKPVIHVPLPLYPPTDGVLCRSDFGMDEGCFYFLCMFDFNSSMARKNPHAVVEAFKRAFPSRSDVRLMVKTSNGHLHWKALRELLLLISGDPRIVVRDDILRKRQVHSLLQCCDAFVSLHRAEGFGLVMAEAMAQGKPVIATRWSGNLDFMCDDNSSLVNFTLRAVRAGEYPHGPGDMWAEPDVDDAARRMRELAENPQEARRLGEAGRAAIAIRLDPSRIGCELAARIAAVGAAKARPSI